MMILAIILAAVQVGTWNLKWFPSGRAEHRASARVEAANIEDAREVVAVAAKPHSVFCFEEVRDKKCVEALVKGTVLTNVVVSTWKRSDNRSEWQQVAIVTDLPVVKEDSVQFDYWVAPRGYLHVQVDAGADGKIDFYGVHLKSNYGGKEAKAKAANRKKREAAMKFIPKEGEKAVVLGDFNMDMFSGEFSGEQTCDILTWSGFNNIWTGLPLDKRGTHIGTKRWPDSTLDYIFYRGLSLEGEPTLGPKTDVSDHRMVLVEVSSK